ncbi:dihydroorotase [Gammaproteobacteria bacterium]|nr:dihydroorotase [Gammaproteobacteria bacterium]MDA9038994.1 dihydroorotase [Gammaproteobacteria bacterium]
MYDLILKNCQIVNEDSIYHSDIAIKNERIALINNTIDAEAQEIIDVEGKYVIPGMIDDQVHFREPGLTHKGSIATESRAALAGGITSYFEMPNVNPTTTTNENLRNKFDLASQKSVGNYSFYLGASNHNIEEIKRVDTSLAAGLKVFMGASTGDMLVDNPDTLEDIFKYCPVNIVTHCEDTPTILKNEQIFAEKYGDDLNATHHPYIRDDISCYLSSSMAIDLAKRNDANLHVLHLTTKKEMDQFVSGAIDGKKITAEVCVHHLRFNEHDYVDLGNQIKCNPSIKKEEDRAAVMAALLNDQIDIIATDHAPHTWEEKSGPYSKAPAGLPLVQHAVQVLLDFYHDGTLSLEHIVKKTSHNVAKRFQIKDRGYIREGYYADLVILDIEKPHTVVKEDLLYKCGWSPFEGTTFHSSIHSTIINGFVAYENGTIKLETPFGKKIEFER